MHLALLLCADEEVHDLAQSWLTAVGMRVVSAQGGHSAAMRILHEPIDLLVLDTLPIYVPGLPSLNGLRQTRPLRVLLIPRCDETPQIGVARIAGVDAVLARPLRKAALLSALEALS